MLLCLLWMAFISAFGEATINTTGSSLSSPSRPVDVDVDVDDGMIQNTRTATTSVNPKEIVLSPVTRRNRRRQRIIEAAHVHVRVGMEHGAFRHSAIDPVFHHFIICHRYHCLNMMTIGIIFTCFPSRITSTFDVVAVYLRE